MILETPRVLLVPTPIHIVRRRLAEEDFIETLDTPEGPQQVTFSGEWPGDPLPIFPGLAAWLAANPGAEQWGGIVLLRETWTAVGQAGFTGGPDAEGVVELGYGIGPRCWGREYATEIVKAFLALAGLGRSSRSPAVHDESYVPVRVHGGAEVPAPLAC